MRGRPKSIVWAPVDCIRCGVTSDGAGLQTSSSRLILFRSAQQLACSRSSCKQTRFAGRLTGDMTRNCNRSRAPPHRNEDDINSQLPPSAYYADHCGDGDVPALHARRHAARHRSSPPRDGDTAAGLLSGMPAIHGQLASASVRYGGNQAPPPWAGLRSASLAGISGDWLSSPCMITALSPGNASKRQRLWYPISSVRTLLPGIRATRRRRILPRAGDCCPDGGSLRRHCNTVSPRLKRPAPMCCPRCPLAITSRDGFIHQAVHRSAPASWRESGRSHRDDRVFITHSGRAQYGRWAV